MLEPAARGAALRRLVAGTAPCGGPTGCTTNDSGNEGGAVAALALIQTERTAKTLQISHLCGSICGAPERVAACRVAAAKQPRAVFWKGKPAQSRRAAAACRLTLEASRRRRRRRRRRRSWDAGDVTAVVTAGRSLGLPQLCPEAPARRYPARITGRGLSGAGQTAPDRCLAQM